MTGIKNDYIEIVVISIQLRLFHKQLKTPSRSFKLYLYLKTNTRQTCKQQNIPNKILPHLVKLLLFLLQVGDDLSLVIQVYSQIVQLLL